MGFLRGALSGAVIAVVFTAIWQVDPLGGQASADQRAAEPLPKIIVAGRVVQPPRFDSSVIEVRQARPFEWLDLLGPGLVGLLAGGVIGALAGRLLGPTQPILARSAASTLLGLACGLWYHPLWSALVVGRVEAEYVVPAQLLVSGLVGLIGGCLWGFFQDLIPIGGGNLDADDIDTCDGTD